MVFKLGTPIKVYSKDDGDYIDADIIEVSYNKGKKGHKAIKSIQDVIFSSFQRLSGSQGSKKSQKDSEITKDEVLSIIEMTGNSEKIFDKVMETLKAFGTIDGKKLSEELQEQMESKDLERLYQEVLETFLLENIIQKMNTSMKR